MPKEVYFEDVNKGDEISKLVKDPLQKLQFVMYSGASGDFNPLHNVDDFAKSVGMEQVISHGMLIMAFVGQAITNWLPRKYLKKLGVRFVGMSHPNETITVSGNVTDKRQEGRENIITCDISAANENGDVKVKGTFEAALPSK